MHDLFLAIIVMCGFMVELSAPLTLTVHFDTKIIDPLRMISSDDDDSLTIFVVVRMLTNVKHFDMSNIKS